MKKNALPIIVLLLFFACGKHQVAEDKMIFRYNESSGIQSLDPAYASGQSTIWPCNQLYNGLVDLDDSLRIVPCIAKSWSISEDGRSYTFILRDDVYFHETAYFPFPAPRKVTASDFVYSFHRIADPVVASPGAWIFQKVAKDENGKSAFNALNDTTLTITLTEAFPPFLGILSMKYCSVVPEEAVVKFGKEFRKFPVGTGPFQMQMWEEGVKLVLRKNPLYFEQDESGTQLPYLDAVAITFIVDKQSVFMEFMKGSLDFMSGVEACYKDALLTKNGELNPELDGEIVLLTGPYLNTEYLGFNLKGDQKDNPLLIKEVRQAINYGIDREKMLRHLRNNIGYAGTSGFVPQGMPSFDPERVKGYDYNPRKASELLAQAGFPNGKGLPPIPLSVSATYLDLCQYIQHELSTVGINITLDVQQAAQQRQMMRNYQLPFFRGSWIADYPDAENYLSLFYSGNLQPFGSNYTHYANPEYDRFFIESQHIINDSLRNDYYTRLDSILMEDAPVVVLYYDEVVRFTRANVKQLGVNPVNMLDLRKTVINH
ncbi:ABC transporter substrate-binding protein [Bacteroidales bacterium OttesenSCG-928-C03]|nr:ABC transporter substrate-binding protein [Bacteroidales bacterium OttesenSCG-928-C03]